VAIFSLVFAALLRRFDLCFLLRRLWCLGGQRRRFARDFAQMWVLVHLAEQHCALMKHVA